MKIARILLLVFTLFILIYNLFSINYSNILGEENIISFIGIVACLCALLLLGILQTSLSIDSSIKKKRALKAQE